MSKLVALNKAAIAVTTAKAISALMFVFASTSYVAGFGLIAHTVFLGADYQWLYIASAMFAESVCLIGHIIIRSFIDDSS